MSWIQLDEDHWALEADPDPQEIVSISELDQQIADLEDQINGMTPLEYPDGASSQMREAIDNYNLQLALDRDTLQRMRDDLQAQRAEILES